MSSTVHKPRQESYVQILAKTIRHERRQLGFSQESFARHIGFDRGYIGGLERGKYNLTFAKLMVVLVNLHADPVDFFSAIPLRRRPPVAVATSARHWFFQRPRPDGLSGAELRAAYAKQLGEAVRYERERSGLSQEDFAHQAGVARSYISGIECGLRNPSFNMLMRILESLGMAPAQFFQHFRFAPP